VGRTPLVRMEETTDLIELVRIVFENLSGFISKMRASPNVGGCRHQRNSASINHSVLTLIFFVERKKIFFAQPARPAARRASFHFYRLFANIFRKRNMSQN
jgi:hypothetical protein